MASWGEIAVGEDRHSADHPTKSALIGMIGAALGVRRDQEDVHSRLASSIGMASLVVSPGTPVEDFHTIQTPPQSELKKGAYFRTRKDELSIGAHAFSTIISRREYRCDTFLGVCLWERDANGPFRLEEIADALNSPTFFLYLGRKSCPPGLPLYAVVVEAPSILDAFREAAKKNEWFAQRLSSLPEAPLYWDHDGIPGIPTWHEYQRRDEIISRKRWTFLNRSERHGMAPINRGEG